MKTFVQLNSSNDSIDIIMTNETSEELNKGYEEGGLWWEEVPAEETDKYFCEECGNTLLTANGTCVC